MQDKSKTEHIEAAIHLTLPDRGQHPWHTRFVAQVKAWPEGNLWNFRWMENGSSFWSFFFSSFYSWTRKKPTIEHNTEIVFPFSVHRTKLHWFWPQPTQHWNSSAPANLCRGSWECGLRMIAIKSTWVGFTGAKSWALRDLHLTDEPRQVWVPQLLSDCVK